MANRRELTVVGASTHEVKVYVDSSDIIYVSATNAGEKIATLTRAELSDHISHCQYIYEITLP